MNRKLPADAFNFYLGLGATRSYEAVAKQYRVSKRSVTSLAVKEHWQQRIAEAERKARERSDEKAVETLEEMNDRHLSTMKFVQKKALETLRTMPIASAMDAVRALTLGVDRERLIRGEPTDRTALDIEQIIKREYKNWMIGAGEDDDADSQTAQ